MLDLLQELVRLRVILLDGLLLRICLLRVVGLRLDLALDHLLHNDFQYDVLNFLFNPTAAQRCELVVVHGLVKLILAIEIDELHRLLLVGYLELVLLGLVLALAGYASQHHRSCPRVSPSPVVAIAFVRYGAQLRK